MPAKSFVMAFVLSGWLIALVLGGMIVGYTGFFGLAVIGVFVWRVSVTIDQERDGAVGAAVTPGFLAQQVRARAEMSSAQRQGFRQEQSQEARLTRLFKHLGMATTLVGLGGFWLFQL